jgi:hypothetical protein
MNPIDGYSLYLLLADGSPHTAEVNGSPYRFQFEGERAGAKNWLLVTAPDGSSQKWGWGWSSEVCWHCLQDIERGWETRRVHAFKPFSPALPAKG